MNFTFGIITAGGQEGRINRIIDSIESQKITNYEIIIVGSCNISRKNLKLIDFNENIKSGWITRKKNIITENSLYENIVYLHDYIIFDENWYLNFLNFDKNFFICMNRILDANGNRFRDWVLWPHNKKELDKIIQDNCLIPYSINHLSKYMYISGSYWVAKKNVMQEFPLNENLSWGCGEDVEWSLRIREKYNFSINEKSIVRLIKENKDRAFNEPNNELVEFLKNFT